MKQTKAFSHNLAAVNNLNTECYVIQRKKCKQMGVLSDLSNYNGYIIIVWFASNFFYLMWIICLGPCKSR